MPICQVLPNGCIRAIYVHHAEPENQIGPVLAQYYPESHSVSDLLDLGDLSTLGTTPRACMAYGRDGGETNTAAHIYGDAATFDAATGTSSCVYLFRDRQWFVGLHGEEWFRLKSNGYAVWHGPVESLVEDMVRVAHGLSRPFEQDDVIGPLWDAGYGVMLHLDDRFRIHPTSGFSRLWTVQGSSSTMRPVR